MTDSEGLSAWLVLRVDIAAASVTPAISTGIQPPLDDMAPVWRGVPNTQRDSISHRAVVGLEAELVSPASSTSRGVTHSNCVLLTIAGQGSTHSYRYERHRGGERERERGTLVEVNQ